MKNENKEVEKILISVKEACKVTGIGRNSLLKLIKNNKNFPCLKFSRKILIDKKGLETWIIRNYR